MNDKKSDRYTFEAEPFFRMVRYTWLNRTGRPFEALQTPPKTQGPRQSEICSPWPYNEGVKVSVHCWPYQQTSTDPPVWSQPLHLTAFPGNTVKKHFWKHQNNFFKQTLETISKKRPILWKNTTFLLNYSDHKFIFSIISCCTPPFEKSPLKTHRFCVLPPLKNHPSKPIGFVYSPLWKITHQSPSVLCTPPFEKSLFLVGAYFGVGVYFGKNGIFIK